MNGTLIIDSNILVLLAVGTASLDYIRDHKNTREHFTSFDFELITYIVSQYSEILLIPHIVAETSNLVRQIANPKKALVQRVLAELVAQVLELSIASIEGCQREEYLDVGITDAIILHLCGLEIGGVSPTLLTIDGPLADRAASLGYNVIDYRRDFQTR